MDVIRRWSWSFITIAILSLQPACTKGFKSLFGGGDSNEASTASKEVSLQKDNGINVGESKALWVVGMKPIITNAGGQLQHTLRIHKITQDPLKNYPTQSWDMTLTGPVVSNTGTRTYVTEYGLLLGRVGGNGHTALYLFNPDTGLGTPAIVETTGNVPGGRATPFSYQVVTGGTTYTFIALAYQKGARDAAGNGVFRVERFWRQGSTWARAKPYEFTHTTENFGVYTGFLDACSTRRSNQCVPKFYGGAFNKPTVFGLDLTVDVPPSPYVNDTSTVAATKVVAPNNAFVSTSHPLNGPKGTINETFYSLAGMPDGNIVMASDPSDGNNFDAYDKVNELAFHSTRRSTALTDATGAPLGPHAVIRVYRKECFYDPAFVNCDPDNTAHSKVFLDVGEELGPTSDLGNGCVAVLSFKRPGEPGGATQITKVYKACIRDRENLARGLTVTLIANVDGAAYMYNDFTAATLYDRPIAMLYDFTERAVQSFKSAKIVWVPKLGFSTTPTGLNYAYRCFNKGQTPPAWSPFALQAAYVPLTLPECTGNQVEIQMERRPGERFTRFQSVTVTAVTE